MSGAYGSTANIRHAATLLCMSSERYATAIAAGLCWCSGHKSFEPAAQFGRHAGRPSGLNTICRDWDRATSRVRSARRHARVRSERDSGATWTVWAPSGGS